MDAQFLYTIPVFTALLGIPSNFCNADLLSENWKMMGLSGSERISVIN